MTVSWNTAQPPAQSVHIVLLSGNALQRRLLSGFLSGTPLPDLVEAYAQIVAKSCLSDDDRFAIGPCRRDYCKGRRTLISA